jgi:hypothetical protein
MHAVTDGRQRGWDTWAAVPAVIALVMIGVYIALIRQQGDHLAAWFVAGLAAAALLALYGVARAAPYRRSALAVSGAVMVVLGVLSLPSIGFLILAAGVLALVATARGAT